ncbi:MAG: DnaD domain protein [Bacilli bacterium]|nr:DnaD domain protein [Bacilli bacterium]MDD3305074.1 DnaD domain protein [Bacilli bacterium]MDD4053438.1 DnaD domain protein [Bacilli bacterium]MDD4410915.1 DnaD domain protein [Bacilli bacterium]
MNIEKLIEAMKMKSIHIPLYLVRNYKALKINEKELLIISVLMESSDVIDYAKMAEYLNIPEQDVLLSLNNIQEKGLLEIKLVKNDDGVMEEHVSIDNLYNKLALNLIGEESTVETNIYEKFEHEFGRTLSSMEYEIISGWLESRYNEEVIIEALREAVYNGASNLRYIDRILYEWNKKGIKSVTEVRKEKEKFNKSKREKIEIPDYNWLEEHE